ncbi:hypothetical protein [Chenggangzhangella methanolivorans]|uniref:Uncharacterized protein n=1 Tax=Chenggangzhangella methanolivorans TaxID=1437009 RepID=A0A9E6UKF3_9HYPH|nr:hypothetical protein [Chenggangzhangella methanolivorans]QZN99236.1 hypothetical protein K6K41_20855 [Chenggangzhangella methanolivorans]
MRKFTIVAVAAAFGVAGAAETVQPAAAAETNAAPRSLEQVRENAMTAMYAGDLQQVRDRRAGRAWRGGGKWRGGRSWRGAAITADADMPAGAITARAVTMAAGATVRAS